jgi:phosphoserine phosphatase
MLHVLSLVADESKSPLTSGDVDRARRALDAAGAKCGAPDWLSANEACEIAFEGGPDAALAAARVALAARPVDANVVADELRRKKLLVADMDSTLIEQECLDELAAEIGMRAEVSAITERAMLGALAFEPALRERVALLKGLSTEVVARLLSSRITITPGAAVLVATMRAFGAHAVLVTGGFTAFAEPIGRRIGFHEQRANRLGIEAGSFTGLVAEPILGRDAKEATLAELTVRLKLEPAETLAVGDGANDIGMIRRAGLGVAYRAKPALRAESGAIIDHADLTGLLFLQGYRREEFVLKSEPAAVAT